MQSGIANKTEAIDCIEFLCYLLLHNMIFAFSIELTNFDGLCGGPGLGSNLIFFNICY